jgi:thiol-disulfide isomerase/thioredoxin
MRACISLSAILLLAAGCNPPEVQDDDAGIVLPDSGPSSCAGDPGAPYGTSEGSNFLPFTLPKCDGTQWSFYGDDEGFCEARFTVVSMAAGWCHPCQQEAALMEENLVQAYGDQGVRVAVALIQDPEYNAPDSTFCQQWVDTYGLTNPVMMDADQVTNIYFPMGALPATVIVDSNGIIRHREYGVTTGLETVRAALDELLAE